MKRETTVGTRQFAMGTRQLQTFCEVIEQRSFSRAAARLGITQPAVTLRVRALEKRLGAKLIDRSGRRVEPTDAGRRLYRGAQRLLELEEEIVNDLAKQASGDLAGSFDIGASSGPGGVIVPELLCSFSKLHPGLRIALSVFDTQMVIERVADRTLELGIVGAAPRHRAVEYEPFFRDPVILACPAGHRFAGRSVTLDELRGEKLILMQDGAGIRQMIEDELRDLGLRLRDFDGGLQLGLQESVTTAVRSGSGVSFISRSSVERELAAGTLAEAHVAELELEREIFLIRASGRSESAASRAFVEYGRAMLAPSEPAPAPGIPQPKRIALVGESSANNREVSPEPV